MLLDSINIIIDSAESATLRSWNLSYPTPTALYHDRVAQQQECAVYPHEQSAYHASRHGPRMPVYTTTRRNSVRGRRPLKYSSGHLQRHVNDRPRRY